MFRTLQLQFNQPLVRGLLRRFNIKQQRIPNGKFLPSDQVRVGRIWYGKLQRDPVGSCRVGPAGAAVPGTTKIGQLRNMQASTCRGWNSYYRQDHHGDKTGTVERHGAGDPLDMALR